MRRFQKRPDLHIATVPGIGRLQPGQILEGERFAAFVPSVLVEIPEVAPGPLLTEVKPPKPTRPNPPPVIIPPPPPPPPAALKNEAFPTPEELEKAVEEENKKTVEQIDAAVEKLTPVDDDDEKTPTGKDDKKKGGKPVKKSGRR